MFDKTYNYDGTIQLADGLGSKMKLYNFKITDLDGNILHNYIPVVDTNGIACLYDEITGKKLYNQKTGNFEAGAPIVEPTPTPPTPPEEPTPVPPKPPTFRPGDVMLQIGVNSGVYNQLGVDLTFDISGFGADISTDENASQTLEKMDKFKEMLVRKRATVGAQRNRLESILKSGAIRKENMLASHSTMLDTDFAVETAKLARQQILRQATTSLLSQANQLPNIALHLLG